jgi:hypothetical protein
MAGPRGFLRQTWLAGLQEISHGVGIHGARGNVWGHITNSGLPRHSSFLLQSAPGPATVKIRISEINWGDGLDIMAGVDAALKQNP